MRYRKKPVVIEAVQWNGLNFSQVRSFMNDTGKVVDRRIRVKSLEGNIYAKEGDYIIKGVEGEFYPCDADIFHKTYEAVDEEDS